MRTYYDVIVSFLQARFNTDERGAALVEYALLVALIAVAAIIAMTALGDGVNSKFEQVSNELGTAGT